MLILRSVGVLSAGKVLGCLYALLGLIVGAFVSLFALAGAAAGQNQPPGAGVMFFGFGVAAIIVIPILYGLFGFIFGIMMAALYNLVAMIVGGLELDIRRDARDDWE